MTVEDRRVSVGEEDASNDGFPVGMRVLAVDDDPTCLKLLENLLRRCEYHVTTTNQAVTALKMLRENKDKYDLVISDVHMPDMDGFKLLELVGLEMDLPVIMLSANSDTSAVMKGITHGACDYLLKPVRIEELKNIWQHVIRRRKIDSKYHNNSGRGHNVEKLDDGMGEGGEAHAPTPGDPSGKPSRKRKDQNDDDDDEECEENGHCNEDPSNQKKPRVVWSVDLHRKFVSAVNQLGLDKAVPKRILDLMNVEKLTRENVASHLQKYRLYLKRISNVASQQANFAAALGGRDLSYLQMGTLDGIGDFHALSGSGQLPKTALSSFQGGGPLGRLNSSSGLALRGLSTSGMLQLGRAQNAANSISDLGKLQRGSLNGTQHVNLLQGMPHSLELDQLQQNRPVSHRGELSSPLNSSTVFSVTQQLTGVAGFPDTGVVSGNNSASFLNVPNNPLLLHGQQQSMLSGGLGNQTSVRMAPMNPEPFDMSVEVSPNLPDLRRCNDTWQNAVPSSGYTANPLSMGASFNRDNPPSGDLRDNISSIASSHIEMNSLNVSPSSVVPAPLHDSMTRRDPHSQVSTFGVNNQSGSCEIDQNSKLSTFGSMTNAVGQNMGYASRHKLEDHNQGYFHNPNLILDSDLSSMSCNNGVMCTLSQNSGQTNPFCYKKMDMTAMGEMVSSAAYQMQNEIDKSTDGSVKLNEEYLLEHAKLQGGFNSNYYDSFDDLVSAIIKRDDVDYSNANGAQTSFATYQVVRFS
eukprot:TRINITY_DN6744_c0_g4_i3.p1 TRINITY_DN6744_c0_g4~~TRINITY_DN6744_c0_g4_i3.p1  ORF type:complete len:748 (-),score=185.28 TRINITY_DN6744_c0_g4_i3:819-3062(-)